MGNTDVWLSYVWYASLDGSLATTIYLWFCIGYYEIREVERLTHETIEKNLLKKNLSTYDMWHIFGASSFNRVFISTLNFVHRSQRTDKWN